MLDLHVIFYYVGVFILLYVNISTFWVQGGRYSGFPNLAAASNLFALVCIAYYFMHREGYIRF